ncbi:TIGR04283 family arsenosugar biosynthesis glycosyltransferase [Alicyclobacillus tolerans]|uniref:TIGR04283 family arsenosugar biosynthesis glycosyltransferase n=1 Tax=Alicyclobacillus tolerans TaxID=90970 RepID=UPI001F004CEC|nr:TIGR04283 family arsenosugar biosynthesis glycosyltransferase [Alicyclobacillus tolerans]MCF8566616.1 TIGR04283 family arsenosugar biosynthesis glycosyltransferase [Alicyclobacillus tolerans]
MPSVSLIVPVLNEAHTIAASLFHLRSSFPACEIIVVDGGSLDNTAEIAKQYARVVMSERGRAHQMNAGASVCSGEILWFIHADSYIDKTALTHIQEVLRNGEVVGGGLTLRFAEDSWSLRLIAKLSNFRARYLHWIFGDQSMFVRRRDFESIGGFPDLPIMEDLEISLLLKKRGELVLLPAISTTSTRRFIEHGTWRTITRMQTLKLQYFLGVDPEDILRKYSNPRGRVRTR